MIELASRILYIFSIKVPLQILQNYLFIVMNLLIIQRNVATALNNYGSRFDKTQTKTTFSVFQSYFFNS